MAKVKLPGGPTDVTPVWLTNALRESGTIRDAVVTGISMEIIGEGVGVLGQLARFTLIMTVPRWRRRGR